MKIALETFAGCVLMLLLVAGVDCLPKKGAAPSSRAPAAEPRVAMPTCKPTTAPALLCDRVTADRTHECAICAERLCLTSTLVLCVPSCDAPECVARAGF